MRVRTTPTPQSRQAGKAIGTSKPTGSISIIILDSNALELIHEARDLYGMLLPVGANEELPQEVAGIAVEEVSSLWFPASA